jgi:hypothetical protein
MKLGKPGEQLFTLPHRFISLFQHSIIPLFLLGIWRMVGAGFPIINNLYNLPDIKLHDLRRAMLSPYIKKFE